MNEFLPWLYIHYIAPYQEERVEGSGYEMDLSLLDTNLTPEDRVNFDKSREFYSLQAFVLGLRTGMGLAESFQGPRN